MDKIIQLIQQDELRMTAIEGVRKLGLPQCYLAAGFIRNLVWDHLHEKSVPTALNDVDVIYFNPNESDPNRFSEVEFALMKNMPQLNWQVRNQAIMHLRNGDEPYKNVIEAMSYWPEKETAVAIRAIKPGEFECISAFGFDSLFNCQITHNPKRKRVIFEDRVKSKGWLKQWPKLTLAP